MCEKNTFIKDFKYSNKFKNNLPKNPSIFLDRQANTTTVSRVKGSGRNKRLEYSLVTTNL